MLPVVACGGDFRWAVFIGGWVTVRLGIAVTENIYFQTNLACVCIRFRTVVAFWNSSEHL